MKLFDRRETSHEDGNGKKGSMRFTVTQSDVPAEIAKKDD